MSIKNIINKSLKAYREGRFYLALFSKINPYFIGLMYIFSFNKNIKIHNPDYIEPSSSKYELEVVNRIFKSYKKMKYSQKNIDNSYLPSKLWEDQLNESYDYLISSEREDDFKKFHFFLSNYGCWKKYHGIANNMLIRNLSRSILGRKYLQNITFKKNLKLWKWIDKKNNDLSELEFFRCGNQSGSFIDNKFIIASSFFNQYYASFLKNIVKDINRPIIAELGGGDGNFVFYLLKKLSSFQYLDFDLPEVVTILSYNFLLQWPEKKFLLYGENELDNLTLENYDFILMPSWEIEKLKDDSVDLFLNKNSLGEMTKKNCETFLYHITRSANYFFHMNHDNIRNMYNDGSHGLLSSEFPIDQDKFDLQFRYLDIGHALHNGYLDYYMDIFIHLYKKRTNSVSSK